MAAPICEDCVKGNRLPGTAIGEMTHVGALETYLASKASVSDGDTSSKKAVVFLTDIFGLPLGNPKIMADQLNEKLGVDVYVPDMFSGPPPVSEAALGPLLPDEPGHKRTIWTKLSLIWVLLTSIHRFIPNRPSVVTKRIEEFIKALKAKGYTDVGVVGYCYGGIMCGSLATTDLVKTAILVHSGPVSLDQVKNFKVPTCWIFAEEDDTWDEKKQLDVEAILREKADTQQYEVKLYKGTTHGFAARPNLSIPAVKQAYEDALEEAASWFKRIL